MNEQEGVDLARRLLHRIAPEADLEAVPADADLRRELDIDSMDFLEFVAGLSRETGLNIPERDYSKIGTLESCARYLAAHAAGSGVSAAPSS